MANTAAAAVSTSRASADAQSNHAAEIVSILDNAAQAQQAFLQQKEENATSHVSAILAAAAQAAHSVAQEQQQQQPPTRQSSKRSNRSQQPEADAQSAFSHVQQLNNEVNLRFLLTNYWKPQIWINILG